MTLKEFFKNQSYDLTTVINIYEYSLEPYNENDEDKPEGWENLNKTVYSLIKEIGAESAEEGEFRVSDSLIEGIAEREIERVSFSTDTFYLYPDQVTDDIIDELELYKYINDNNEVMYSLHHLSVKIYLA